MTVAVASSKPLHETHRVAVGGAVDADGHIIGDNARALFGL